MIYYCNLQKIERGESDDEEDSSVSSEALVREVRLLLDFPSTSHVPRSQDLLVNMMQFTNSPSPGGLVLHSPSRRGFITLTNFTSSYF